MSRKNLKNKEVKFKKITLNPFKKQFPIDTWKNRLDISNSIRTHQALISLSKIVKSNAVNNEQNNINYGSIFTSTEKSNVSQFKNSQSSSISQNLLNRSYKKSLENYYFQEKCHPNKSKIIENSKIHESSIMKTQMSHDHWNSDIPTTTDLNEEIYNLRNILTPQSNISIYKRQETSRSNL